MKDATQTDKIWSKKPVKLNSLNVSELKEYFENSWGLNEILFSSIKAEETFFLSPDPLRNPLIFYWGHTACFYINKLLLAGLIKKGINERFEELFAIGVDPDSAEELEKNQRWPTLQELEVYRKNVFEVVQDVIEKFPAGERVNQNSPWWALLMSIEHDRIHFETSSVLFRQLSNGLLSRPKSWEYAPTFGKPTENNLLEVEGGKVLIGKPLDDEIYGWDNEYGHLEKNVLPFTASQNLISNAEFKEFVEDGGYQRKEFWTDEGWKWVNDAKVDYPKFWVKKGKEFSYRTVFEEIKMPYDFPVEVNAHEAWAFCRWKGEGFRLLSEAEYVFIAKKVLREKREPAYSDKYNLHIKYGSPTPVGFMDKENKTDGFNDVFGNVWDWLSDDFYSLSGFQTHPFYEDFSVPFFDPYHSMLLGGSWATTGTGASSFYRLWFRRHFFQHAGFRLAKSL